MAGSDRQTKLLVALQTGEGAPDYCDVNITAFGTFFDYEEIPFLTLTDLVADERDVYVQAKLDIYSTGGELYGAPSQLGGTVVYYNTDITEAAGVDIDSIVTWDDYVAAGKQVLEKTGKPMTVIETTDMAPFQAMVLQKGSDFLDAEGNVILDCATNIELLEYLKSWMDEGIAIPMPGGGNASEIFYEFFNNSGAASVILPMWYMSRRPNTCPTFRQNRRAPHARMGSGGHRGIHHRLHRRQRRCNHQSVRIARAGQGLPLLLQDEL